MNMHMQQSVNQCAASRPRVTIKPETGELRIRLRRRLRMRCTASGRPTPTITWLHNDVIVTPSARIRLRNDT